MDKPVKKTREAFDYHECRDYLQDKYQYSERDYAGHFGEPAQNSPAVAAAPIEKNESVAWDEERPPYWDFWHFVIDHTEMHNGTYITMSEEWLPMATDWQKEIIQHYIDEFAEPATHDEECREVEFYVEW